MSELKSLSYELESLVDDLNFAGFSTQLLNFTFVTARIIA